MSIDSAPPAPTSADGSRGVATKLITLIEAVASAEHGTSVREISRDTGIDKSTVSRIFGQLRELDIVVQSPITGRFEVGPRLGSLGEVLHTHNSLWGIAEPIVRNLVERFDETCYLIEREANQARFRERVDCKQAIRYVIEKGQVSPLYAGAAGRGILAGISPDESRRYLEEEPIRAVTEHTVIDRDLVAKLVEEDRRRGFTVSAGERVPGGHGVASPIFRADGDCVGAILWTCPSLRFDETRIPEYGHAVRQAAADVSSRLGWTPST